MKIKSTETNNIEVLTVNNYEVEFLKNDEIQWAEFSVVYLDKGIELSFSNNSELTKSDKSKLSDILLNEYFDRQWIEDLEDRSDYFYDVFRDDRGSVGVSLAVLVLIMSLFFYVFNAMSSANYVQVSKDIQCMSNVLDCRTRGN